MPRIGKNLDVVAYSSIDLNTLCAGFLTMKNLNLWIPLITTLLLTRASPSSACWTNWTIVFFSSHHVSCYSWCVSLPSVTLVSKPTSSLWLVHVGIPFMLALLTLLHHLSSSISDGRLGEVDQHSLYGECLQYNGFESVKWLLLSCVLIKFQVMEVWGFGKTTHRKTNNA